MTQVAGYEFSTDIRIAISMSMYSLVPAVINPFIYWTPLSKLIVMFKKPVWDHLSFVTWCIVLLEVAIRRCVHRIHKGMDMVGNNTRLGCGV